MPGVSSDAWYPAAGDTVLGEDLQEMSIFTPIYDSYFMSTYSHIRIFWGYPPSRRSARLSGRCHEDVFNESY